MKYKILIIIVLNLMLGGTLFAEDSWRCRGKIIERGMTMDEVQKHCGKPHSASVDNQAIHSGNRITGTTAVTTWRYKQPGGQLTAVLVFDVEKLQSINIVDKLDED